MVNKYKIGKNSNKKIRFNSLLVCNFCFKFNTRYLETEGLEHCVPSSVSSGLANLPLSYVFLNGKKTVETTSKQLPDGEPLNGRKAYESIMPYFTTIDKTPDDVHQLGKVMLRKLYPEVNNLTHHDAKKTKFVSRLSFPFPAGALASLSWFEAWAGTFCCVLRQDS